MEKTKIVVSSELFQERLKLFIPNLLIAYVACTFVPALLKLFFVDLVGVTSIQTEIWMFFVPILVTTLVFIIFFRKRISNISYTQDNKGNRGVLIFFAAIPSVISGVMMSSMFNEATQQSISNAAKISSMPVTNLYSVDTISFDTDKKIIDSRVSTFPKKERTEVTIEYFMIIPIEDKSVSDITKMNVWYSQSYKTSLDIFDILTDDAFDKKVRNADSLFYLECRERFSKIELDSIKYLSLFSHSFSRDNVIEVLKSNVPEITNELFIVSDIPKSSLEKKDTPIGDYIQYLLLILIIGLIPPFPFLLLSGNKVKSVQSK